LQAWSSPPSEEELDIFLSRIAATGRYAEARAMWTKLNGLPGAVAVAAPYDGGFRKLPGSAPFNWRINSLGTGTARMALSENGHGRLSISYPASAQATIAEQLQTLAPGAYHLRGRWNVTGAAPGAAVVWAFTCATTAAPLGEWKQRVDTQSPWASFDVAFTVPSDCPAQWLRLSNRSGDGFGDLEAAFSDLSIVPSAAG